MRELFSHEYITDKIVRVRDASFTAVYVILGKEKTVLLDTGIGVGNLREYIEKNINRKIDLVILTHGHLDVPELKEENVLDHMDPEATLSLSDEQVFDIGGVHLKTIHTPGHTMGMMMVLIEEERFLLTGDGCGMGVLLVEDCCSTVETYRNSLVKLGKYEPFYDHILRNHGTCVSEKTLIRNVIGVAEEILAGTDDRIPTRAVIESSFPVFQAKETFPGTQDRVDGKQGNIIYAVNKIC